MKILHISMYSWAAGGLSKVVYSHSDFQAKMGNEVEIWSVINKNDKVYDVPTGVKLTTFRANWFSRFLPFFSIDFYSALKHKSANFDVIHLHGIFHFGSIAPYFFAKSTPKIISIHGMLDKWAFSKGRLKKVIFSTLIQKKLCKQSAILHVEQPQEWLDSKAYLEGFDENFFELPNGIDTHFFKDLPKKGIFRNKFNIPSDKKIVLFLSRLNFKKGLDILLPAFQKLSHEMPNALLILAGPDDGYEVIAKQFVQENNLSDSVIFTGMLTGDDKLAAFNDADVFVLPSYSEGFSMAVLEAMAIQIPIVVSEHTGFSEVIRKWNAGEVRDLNAESVAEGIKRVLSSDDYAKFLKNNALAMVGRLYELNVVEGKLLEKYQNIR